MSHIELASEVGDDFERILDHLAQYQVENPALRIREIIVGCPGSGLTFCIYAIQKDRHVIPCG